jgi:hypothetical protein
VWMGGAEVAGRFGLPGAEPRGRPTLSSCSLCVVHSTLPYKGPSIVTVASQAGCKRKAQLESELPILKGNGARR